MQLRFIVLHTFYCFLHAGRCSLRVALLHFYLALLITSNYHYDEADEKIMWRTTLDKSRTKFVGEKGFLETIVVQITFKTWSTITVILRQNKIDLITSQNLSHY